MTGKVEELFPLRPFEVEPIDIAKLRTKPSDRFHTHRTRIALGLCERRKELKVPLPLPTHFGTSTKKYPFKQSTCYNEPHLKQAVCRPEKAFRKAEYIDMIRHLQREHYENIHMEQYLQEVQQAMDTRRQKAEEYKLTLNAMQQRFKDDLTEGTHIVGQKGRDLMKLWDARKPYLDEYQALENKFILAKHTLMELAIDKFVPRVIAMELVYLMTDRKWKEKNDWIHRKDDGTLEEAIESIKNALYRLRWIDELLDPSDFKTALYFYLDKPKCCFEIIPDISVVRHKYIALYEVPSNYFHLSVVAIQWMEFRDSFDKLMKQVNKHVTSANDTAVLLTCQKPRHERRPEFLRELVTASMDKFATDQLDDKKTWEKLGLAILQAARIIYDDKFMQDSFIKLNPKDQAIVFSTRVKDLLDTVDACNPTNIFILWINTLMTDFLRSEEVSEMVKKWNHLTRMQLDKKKAYMRAMKTTEKYLKGNKIKYVVPKIRRKPKPTSIVHQSHKEKLTPIGTLLERIKNVNSVVPIVEKADCPIHVAMNAGIKNARRKLM